MSVCGVQANIKNDSHLGKLHANVSHSIKKDLHAINVKHTLAVDVLNKKLV